MILFTDRPIAGHFGKGAQFVQRQDGWALTAELLVQANAKATAELQSRLREGRLAPEVPALPALRT